MARIRPWRLSSCVTPRGHLAATLQAACGIVDITRGDIGARGAQYQPAIAIVQALGLHIQFRLAAERALTAVIERPGLERQPVG